MPPQSSTTGFGPASLPRAGFGPASLPRAGFGAEGLVEHREVDEDADLHPTDGVARDAVAVVT